MVHTASFILPVYSAGLSHSVCGHHSTVLLLHCCQSVCAGECICVCAVAARVRAFRSRGWMHITRSERIWCAGGYPGGCGTRTVRWAFFHLQAMGPWAPAHGCCVQRSSAGALVILFWFGTHLFGWKSSVRLGLVHADGLDASQKSS